MHRYRRRRKLIVDTGFGESLRSMRGQDLQSLTAAGYTADQMTMVVLTHLHRDRIGGLMEAGAPTFKNARYVLNARSTTSGCLTRARVLRQKPTILWSSRTSGRWHAKMPFLKDGQDIVTGITAIAAPGHSPGHTILNTNQMENGRSRWPIRRFHYALNLPKDPIGRRGSTWTRQQRLPAASAFWTYCDRSRAFAGLPYAPSVRRVPGKDWEWLPLPSGELSVRRLTRDATGARSNCTTTYPRIAEHHNQHNG